MATAIQQKHVTHEVFESMKKIRSDIDDILDTLEVMNDKELMDGIVQSKKDFAEGRHTKFKSREEMNDYLDRL